MGTVPPLDRLASAAIDDAAWQVGVGAAEWPVAGKPLLRALADQNADVRKAAVRALSRWASEPEVAAELRVALIDPDVDVRAYARRAVVSTGH